MKTFAQLSPIEQAKLMAAYRSKGVKGIQVFVMGAFKTPHPPIGRRGKKAADFVDYLFQDDLAYRIAE